MFSLDYEFGPFRYLFTHTHTLLKKLACLHFASFVARIYAGVVNSMPWNRSCRVEAD